MAAAPSTGSCRLWHKLDASSVPCSATSSSRCLACAGECSSGKGLAQSCCSCSGFFPSELSVPAQGLEVHAHRCSSSALGDTPVTGAMPAGSAPGCYSGECCARAPGLQGMRSPSAREAVVAEGRVGQGGCRVLGEQQQLMVFVLCDTAARLGAFELVGARGCYAGVRHRLGTARSAGLCPAGAASIASSDVNHQLPCHQVSGHCLGTKLSIFCFLHPLAATAVCGRAWHIWWVCQHSAACRAGRRKLWWVWGSRENPLAHMSAAQISAASPVPAVDCRQR